MKIKCGAASGTERFTICRPAVDRATNPRAEKEMGSAFDI